MKETKATNTEGTKHQTEKERKKETKTERKK